MTADSEHRLYFRWHGLVLAIVSSVTVSMIVVLTFTTLSVTNERKRSAKITCQAVNRISEQVPKFIDELAKQGNASAAEQTRLHQLASTSFPDLDCSQYPVVVNK